MLSAWSRACKNPPVAIEGMLPKKAVDSIVGSVGEAVAIDSTRRCGSMVHRKLSAA